MLSIETALLGRPNNLFRSVTGRVTVTISNRPGSIYTNSTLSPALT
jgi:hypothetical protein